MRLFFAGLILGVGLAAGRAEEVVSRIAFGSCYKPEKSTSLWGKVAEYDPQVWLWLGDNVYVDFINGEYVKANLDPKAFEQGYERLAKSEGVATLKNLPSVQVMATWDDHDYGLNDAGRNWERKEEARKAFVKFWGGEDRADGVYSSRDFGPEGKRVRVILLDTRFNRDDPGPKGDILGPAQWKWLETEVLKPGADVLVIGSSIQVVAQNHPFEKWGNFPASRERLYLLLGRSAAGQKILLSGDRHFGEILRAPIQGKRPVFEITTSGLTEGYDPRWGTAWASQKSLSPLRFKGIPDPNRVMDPFYGRNYGTIEISWDVQPPRITAKIRREDGTMARQVDF